MVSQGPSNYEHISIYIYIHIHDCSQNQPPCALFTPIFQPFLTQGGGGDFAAAPLLGTPLRVPGLFFCSVGLLVVVGSSLCELSDLCSESQKDLWGYGQGSCRGHLQTARQGCLFQAQRGWNLFLSVGRRWVFVIGVVGVVGSRSCGSSCSSCGTCRRIS